MRKLFVLLAAASLLFAGCQKEENQGAEPEIQLVGLSGNLNIPVEGGVCEVEYTIVNAVEGGEVSAVSDEDWVGTIDCSVDNVVKMNVPAWTGSDNRSALVTVIYTYGDGQTVNCTFNVIQNGTGIEVDYDYTMTLFTGEYYGNDGLGGAYEFYTILHNRHFIDGDVDAEGMYFLLDIYAAELEDAANPLPAAGVYAFSSSESPEKNTFSSASSGILIGGQDNAIMLKGGEISISYDENGKMVVDAMLTAQNDDVYHVKYSGDARYEDYSIGGGRDEMYFEAISVSGAYLGGSDGMMEVKLTFRDGTNYFRLFTDMFMPFDEEGNIMEGTYNIVADAGEALTMAPGGYTGSEPYGTYMLEYLSEMSADAIYYFATEGSLTVSGNKDDGYVITADMMTEDGTPLKCDYTGRITIDGIPVDATSSTLTGDYTLDLSKVDGAYAYYYQDWSGLGYSECEVTMEPADGLAGDGLKLKLYIEGKDINAGILTGTYTAAETGNASAWRYQIGSGDFSGAVKYANATCYVLWDDAGMMQGYAPAVSGDLHVTNNGNDNYTLEFSFKDDAGHTWDVKWTGDIDVR